ncbi:hypothetical protein CC78DRAFT_508670 [Lojkania enalia]|uniref:Uncharacterized protein n=1 Tax=Lojkania enalia TaxID=147567 RepID=A0A9P4TPB4_9PLEO|nr:hypothetical protein CC78DRAFT_508670 [Didymosphaeria enalia]
MSARKLTDGHMARAVRNAREPEVTDPKKLEKDQMRLYSFYKPSLQAGFYEIEATQRISSGEEHLEVTNTSADADPKHAIKPQEFEVVVPRFSLDRNIINSYYPPDGHEDEGRILPHLVLNDPHYPWEIAAGITTRSSEARSSKDDPRNMVPWVALLVFDPADLHLSKLEEAKALNLPGFTEETDMGKQNGSGTFSMPISDYFGKINKSAQINYAAGYNDRKEFTSLASLADPVDIIFPRKSLIQSMFTDKIQVSTSDGIKETDCIGVEQYKYLAHVRHINTEGCPDAGIEQEGLFSIVIASRTGALKEMVLEDNKWKELSTNMTQPRTQICHLVSIEHLDSTLGTWAIKSEVAIEERVGMVSLFSWVYTALPADPVNFVSTMRNLTENQQMLRADDKIISKLDTMETKNGPSKALAERLKRGYTLARWRTQTGEETSAFTRGPLIPLKAPHPPAPVTMPDCSTNSQDYQILDPETGLMDLSYSSAWQLGKLLAISDCAFNSALMRFRSVVRNTSADSARMIMNGMHSKTVVIQAIAGAVASIRDESNGDTSVSHRIRAPSDRQVATDVKDVEALPVFTDELRHSIEEITGAGTDEHGAPILYNGFNKEGPSNSDWPIIHSWMAEKLSLGGIPPQYIIPEPSFVPPESLRFFHIDDFWLDCLLDGALSVANHLDEDDDFVRREIKKRFNEYLATDVPEAGFKPQIPCYGFIIRSKLVKAMPDLRITVNWNNSDNRFPVCRWTRWDDQTLMCLLDREPEELNSIVLAQPQHQQRFALGSGINAENKKVDYVFRQLYTSSPGISPDEKKLINSNASEWLNFDTRCLYISKMASEINRELGQVGKEAYNDPTPNSCELGLELNDPSYYFKIRPPLGVDQTPRPRQRALFVREQNTTRVLLGEKDSISPRLRATQKQVKIQKVKSGAAGKAKQTQNATLRTTQTPHNQLLVQPFQPLLKSSVSMASSAAKFAASSTPQSNFSLTIFPDYRNPPVRQPARGGREKYPANDYIPTENIFYFDLIFSIRKRATSKTSTDKLIKIVFDIPIESTPRAHEALLGRNYDGPGVRMLSNQFFVPILQNDATKPFLHVILVPRAANFDYKLLCNDRKTVELGFRLAETNIAPTTPGKETYVEMEGKEKMVGVGKVLITWSEWYSTAAHPEGEAVVNSYAVLKLKTRDDQEIEM